MVLVKLNQADVGRAWHRVEGHVRGVCERHPHDFAHDDIKDRAEKGLIQVWIVWEPDEKRVLAVCGTDTSIGHDNHLTVTILFCTGEGHRAWAGFISEIEDWGRAIGATRVKGWMRPGWERALPGYRRTHVMLEKELT